MGKQMRHFLVTALLFISFIITAHAQQATTRNAGKLIGQEVGLKLKDLSGDEQSLDALKGRIVILNFWATYCIPCRTEMPELVALQNEFGALGVQVIGASADTAKDKNKVLQFVKENKINFPVWLGVTTAATVRFGLTNSLPATVVIGKDGKIAKVLSGVFNPDALKMQIESMLSASSVSRL